MIRPVVEYACQVWYTSLTGAQTNKLEWIQRRALRSVYLDASYAEALSQSGLLRLSQRMEDLSKAFFRDMLSPSHRLHHLLPPARGIPYGLRRRAGFSRFHTRCSRFQKTLVAHGLRHWQ